MKQFYLILAVAMNLIGHEASAYNAAEIEVRLTLVNFASKSATDLAAELNRIYKGSLQVSRANGHGSACLMKAHEFFSSGPDILVGAYLVCKSAGTEMSRENLLSLIAQISDVSGIAIEDLSYSR